MQNVRIIPRLDIKGPNLVKGISFDGYRVLGRPEDFAQTYYEEGADELIYYDTVASLYQRNSLDEIVRRTAEEIFIPLTVAGGLRTLEDIRRVLRAGADKVAINTAAIARPDLIREAAETFGSQCIVISIEAKRLDGGRYEAWVDYGRQPTSVDAVVWAQRAVERGAGEVLVTYIDREGTGRGYDLELTAEIARRVRVPVVACGGAGRAEHFVETVLRGQADAVSAATVFHLSCLKPVKTLYMASNEPRLRMGKPLDEGNVDFVKTRLNAGLPERRFQAMSVCEVRQEFLRSGIPCRRFSAQTSQPTAQLQEW